MVYVVAIGCILFLSAALIFAGAVEINRRAERWERYEKWIHPPDDDDGVNLLEDAEHSNEK